METAEDASTFAAGNRSSAPAPATARAFSAKRFLRYLIILVGAGLAAIATANYLLDSLHFRRSALRELAAAHQSGKNYAVYQANLDYRALRREAVALMTKTPQIIVFGGSRFELARADMFPGGHEGPVDADSMDDMDVLHADGSMAFSKEHSASFRDLLLSRGVKNMVSTAATVAEDAEQRGAKMSELSEWPIDPRRIEGLGKLWPSSRSKTHT